MKFQTLIVTLTIVLFGALPAMAGDTLYVDLSGIDTAFPELTEAQRQELKDLIIADIQANFTVAGVDITVTTDASADADRTVHIKDDMGTHTRSDGTTGHHYGEWAHGSDEANVHLDNFTERHGDDYKDADGNWDLDKLRKGIGRTAAHEIAHSYSVGHNSEGDNPDKMTEGGLVSSETRANTEWIFDDHTAEVMNENLGEDPCETTTDYDEEYIEPVFTDAPLFPNPQYDPNDPDSDPFNDLDEYGNFDARLFIEGYMAESFDLGWYGRDTDNGLEDGNADFDFIYKASMAESDPTAQLTFFELAHATAQFVLRGREGTEWAGIWFPMSEAEILFGDPIVTPEGEDIFRWLNILWDIDGDNMDDVSVILESNMFYPWGAEFNGWRLGRIWPCRGDLDNDFDIDLSDLAQLLSNYGTEYGALYADGDLDGDRDIDLSDLAALLSVYGTTCPSNYPDFSVGAPYTSPPRTTCGAGDDCSPPSQLYPTEDHTYEVFIPYDAYWTFSLCASGFDTWLAVGVTLCGEEIGYNDDFCGLQSELTAFIEAGTYYVDVEGYSGCGDYILDIFSGTVPVCVPPGQDCWHTPCGGSQVSLANHPIPADFFGPGSDPFDGVITLGSPDGTVDTILERMEEMCFEPVWPSYAQTQIQLVQLDLMSCEPITVTTFGEPALWDVHVSISPTIPVEPGMLAATKLDANGGVFSAEYFIQPLYTFTRIEPPHDVVVWNPGEFGEPALYMQLLIDTSWSHDESFDVCTLDGFAPGTVVTGTGDVCCEQVCTESVEPGRAIHCYRVPDCPDCD